MTDAVRSEVKQVETKLQLLACEFDKLAGCIEDLDEKGHDTNKLRAHLQELYQEGEKMKALVASRVNLM